MLYPNAQHEAAGPKAAKQDIAECRELAENYVPSDDGGRDVATSTATGGAVGGAAGAAGGAIRGSPGVGAAVGAAVSGTFAFFRALFRKRDPDPIKQRFVERCLAKRGYEVVGWR